MVVVGGQRRRISAIYLRRIWVAGPWVLKKAHKIERPVIYKTCCHGKKTCILVFKNMFC